MTKRTRSDTHQMFAAAVEEANRRGDRRLQTDHMLLGLLDDPASDAAQALGIDAEAARAASAGLDQAALAAVGVNAELAPERGRRRKRRHVPLTSGARSAMRRSVREMARERKSRHPTSRHILLALLESERPDPAAELLTALKVDTAAVRERLAARAS